MKYFIAAIVLFVIVSVLYKRKENTEAAAQKKTTPEVDVTATGNSLGLQSTAVEQPGVVYKGKPVFVASTDYMTGNMAGSTPPQMGSSSV